MAKLRRPTDDEIEEAIHDARALARESEQQGDDSQARISNDYADALEQREEEALSALAQVNYEARQEEQKERKSAKAGK